MAPTEDQKKEVFKELVYSYIKKDIYESGAKDEESYYKIMLLLASQTGKLVNSQEIASIIGKNRLTVQAYMRTMQQSFHLQLVKPFHGSSRKELTKMPKVYFRDTGLANYLTQHLQPRATLASHTGTLLENIVWKQLVDRYDTDEIRFRRTQQGHEVDFIIPHLSKAYEVKIDATKFVPSKYTQFTSTYPTISLSPIDIKQSFALATEQ